MSSDMKERHEGNKLPNTLGRIRKVEKYLSSNDCHQVYVIDEVDFLLTRSQEILYTLFNMAYEETTKLVLILIANTMDFPKQLTPKVQSRMGDHHLVFKQYTKRDIKAIVR